jgi:hypothetical protein
MTSEQINYLQKRVKQLSRKRKTRRKAEHLRKQLNSLIATR